MDQMGKICNVTLKTSWKGQRYWSTVASGEKNIRSGKYYCARSTSQRTKWSQALYPAGQEVEAGTTRLRLREPTKSAKIQKQSKSNQGGKRWRNQKNRSKYKFQRQDEEQKKDPSKRWWIQAKVIRKQGISLVYPPHEMGNTQAWLLQYQQAK